MQGGKYSDGAGKAINKAMLCLSKTLKNIPSVDSRAFALSVQWPRFIVIERYECC